MADQIDIHNGIDRYVFIGTGRLLDVTDFTDPPVPQQQTRYAIRDGSLQTPAWRARTSSCVAGISECISSLFVTVGKTARGPITSGSSART